jgi:metallo-beta-lactamase family protein
MTFRLTACGGADTVTGANFLVEVGENKILVDCGLTQGADACGDSNYEPFPYDPSTIHALFITHAHLDHVGRIPKLVREGFSGPIYATAATIDLTELMLDDSLGLLTKEATRKGRAPLYTKEDVAASLRLMRPLAYHQTHTLREGVTVELLDAGHILGSAMVLFSAGGKKFVLTGDLGNSPSPFLRDTEFLPNVDYILMESVYGDRNHEPESERVPKLKAVIQEAIDRGGVLMIPAFSIERTEHMLYEISNLMEKGLLPKVPVFLDSPLAIHVEEVYRKHAKEYFKDSVQEELRREGDIFAFPMLTKTLDREDSDAIAHEANPKIIIAGAGMSHGGRIQKHEKRYLSDPKSTLLLVGYQAAGSVGRKLHDGAKEITIDGETIPVRATVRILSGFSAHKDRDHLVDFIAHGGPTLKRVFVTMGERGASQFLVQRLREYLGVQADLLDTNKAIELP